MKIAIIDSGVFESHPHIGRISGAVSFAGDDPIDRMGHGTAVTAAVRDLAPNAELYSVKVFDRRLSVTIDAIVQALQWCRDHSMDLINLSLGTANPDHRAVLAEAVSGNGLIVSAAGMLPGDLPAVVAVAVDEELPRDRFHYREGRFFASPYPRDIPGVPRDRNLHGVSFAVANMTGLAARAWPATRESLSLMGKNHVQS